MAPETATRTRTADANVTAFLTSLPRKAHWLPRLIGAAIFLDLGFFHWTIVDGFADMFGLSVFTSFLVATAEVAIGILLLIGGVRGPYADLATRMAGLLIVPVMLGAIVIAHWPRWSFVPDADAGFPMGGMEFQVVLLALGLFLAMRGVPSAK